MSTVAMIQARMGSTRFPRKVLHPLALRPALLHVVDAVRKSKMIDQAVVATSTEPQDDLLVQFCEENQIPTFRGSENDVLDRFFKCANHYSASTIIRVTADCPLFDPTLAEAAITLVNAKEIDYATNVIPPTFPDGLDYSVFSHRLLEAAAKEAELSSEREHVVPWMWKMSSTDSSKPYRAAHFVSDIDFSELRWTLDYPEDLPTLEKLIQLRTSLNLNTLELARFAKENPDQIPKIHDPKRDEGYLKSLQEDRKVK